LKEKKEKNTITNIQVSGEGWFDKQWGNFKMLPWHWFSLRFDDGESIMLFNFLESGQRDGTYIPKDGIARPLQDFSAIPDTIQENSSEIGMIWKVSLPIKDSIYFIEPVLRLPYQKTRFGITYWEGLCRLLDRNGKSKGWCVAEVAK